jgi:hypothetical protein
MTEEKRAPFLVIITYKMIQPSGDTAIPILVAQAHQRSSLPKYYPIGSYLHVP